MTLYQLKRRTTTLLAIVALAVAGVFLVSDFAQVVSYTDELVSGVLTATGPTPKTPIKHIIIIMNENHAFDNFYGVYPNVPSQYALNLTSCLPKSLSQSNLRNPCDKPFNADNMSQVQMNDLCHTEPCSVTDYDVGKMNGFIQGENTTNTMAYYDGRGIPELWDLASYFDLDYYFFSSAISYSESNHLYAVSANTPAMPFYSTNATGSNFLNFTYPEIGSELTENGLSWGYFQYNWRDAADCSGNYRSQAGLFTGSGGDGYWEGEAQFRQVQDTAIECSSLGNIKDFENALATNTLPAVSWVEPEPSESCHPGQGTLEACQEYTTSVIDDIEQSPEWNSSVTFLTWDEYGGYYDSVVPTQIDQWGDGFRVPLLVISPYTKQGLVGVCPAGTPSGTTKVCVPSFTYYNNASLVHGVTQAEDFSAFLSTIEYNWGLGNLTDTDGEEPNLFYTLNFSQDPLEPLYFNPNYNLSAYPLSRCYAGDGCRLGTAFVTNVSQMSPANLWLIENHAATSTSSAKVYSVYNASSPSWAEPNQESERLCGCDDPGD
jgi:phospholipase C